MDKYIVIKNGLVLTLDRKRQTGYFNVVIKNNKIFLIDYERKFNENEFKTKNPDAEIIDATAMLIMPGFFNSKTVSSYSLNKIFFKKCSYENIHSWLSLKLIDRYLSIPENFGTLTDLMKINYLHSLQNGEIFINEGATAVRKEFSDLNLKDVHWIKQYFNLTSHDFSMLAEPYDYSNFLSAGFNTDEDINNYSLTSIRKSLTGNQFKLFIEASFSQKTVDSIKKMFGKAFVNVLAEMELVSENTIISNPTHLMPGEIEIMKKKKASVLISPSDYVNLSEKRIDIDEIVQSGLNIIVGTGYTGNDILSELKALATLSSRNILPFENILQMSVQNPSSVFGVSNLTGSVERNKSADLIFFDLKDFRNILTLPELTSETVCEFIIQNLTSKDITDVMLKGEILIRDRKVTDTSLTQAQSKAKEISERIYSTGKYFEFKEKYLMRGRVDKLRLDKEEEIKEDIKEEIFVDMTETGEYLGEGEFTILGAKEEEFEKPRVKEEKRSPVNLKEIKSLKSGINLFDEEEVQEIHESAPINKRNKKAPGKGLRENEKTALPVKEPDKKEKETEETEKPINVEKQEELKDPEIQKAKLKFGFKDEE